MRLGGPRTDRSRTLGLARDLLHHDGEIGEVVFEEFHQLGAPSLWPTCLPSLTASERAADQGQTAKEDDGQARRRDGHEAVVGVITIDLVIRLIGGESAERGSRVGRDFIPQNVLDRGTAAPAELVVG